MRAGQNKPRAEAKGKPGSVLNTRKQNRWREEEGEKKRKEAGRSAYNVHLFFLRCLSRARIKSASGRERLQFFNQISPGKSRRGHYYAAAARNHEYMT